MKKKLFIVGGGWLGIELAQKIEANKKANAMFDITIIDKKKVMYNNISGLQACVEPDLVSGSESPPSRRRVQKAQPLFFQPLFYYSQTHFTALPLET